MTGLTSSCKFIRQIGAQGKGRLTSAMNATDVSQNDETKIVIAVLARGLVETHAKISEGRGILRQSSEMCRGRWQSRSMERVILAL